LKEPISPSEKFGADFENSSSTDGDSSALPAET